MSKLQLSAVDGVEIYGPPPSVGRAALCSFNVEGLHATDVSTLLDQSGSCALRNLAAAAESSWSICKVCCLGVALATEAPCARRALALAFLVDLVK